MLISIEGNIGSGKSTVIELLKSIKSDKYVFIDEPVNEWLQIKDKDGHNALECFYKDKKENAYCFQSLAYITRLKNLLNCLNKYNNDDVFIITERSINTDRNVFAKMLYEDGYLSSIEWETYNFWFNTFNDKTNIDMVIYIKTDPSICFQRIAIRNREEENSITLDYLIKCHDYHEKWLDTFPNKYIINGNNSKDYVKNQVNNLLK
jgi:deoxyadenosine/deoxycytidine kinase